MLELDKTKGDFAMTGIDLEGKGREESDICGLCGLPGADKVAHPVHWPGEQIPDGQYVHAECEREECKRAFRELTPQQRASFLLGLR
jgi:hypothetical protein